VTVGAMVGVGGSICGKPQAGILITIERKTKRTFLMAFIPPPFEFLTGEFVKVHFAAKGSTAEKE